MPSTIHRVKAIPGCFRPVKSERSSLQTFVWSTLALQIRAGSKGKHHSLKNGNGDFQRLFLWPTWRAVHQNSFFTDVRSRSFASALWRSAYLRSVKNRLEGEETGQRSSKTSKTRQNLLWRSVSTSSAPVGWRKDLWSPKFGVQGLIFRFIAPSHSNGKKVIFP